MNTDLEKAIEEKCYVSFDYRNANGEQSSQRVEPLANMRYNLQYKRWG
ncbi:MAG: WYL domain-containing protein [Lachnospiraceae bacterium]|nr:WYL domain-containing protein [Lachnospiraceae bacterium]